MPYYYVNGNEQLYFKKVYDALKNNNFSAVKEGLDEIAYAFTKQGKRLKRWHRIGRISGPVSLIASILTIIMFIQFILANLINEDF